MTALSVFARTFAGLLGEITPCVFFYIPLIDQSMNQKSAWLHTWYLTRNCKCINELRLKYSVIVIKPFVVSNWTTPNEDIGCYTCITPLISLKCLVKSNKKRNLCLSNFQYLNTLVDFCIFIWYLRSEGSWCGCLIGCLGSDTSASTSHMKFQYRFIMLLWAVVLTAVILCSEVCPNPL